jgi:hypothetical protein
MRLQELTLQDQGVLRKLLGEQHELSVYAFENIYIWKALFKIYWAKIEDAACIFFQDATGIFMYLPPLSGKVNSRAIEASFTLMDKINKNPQVTRIENIEEKDAWHFDIPGFVLKKKFPEYLYDRERLAGLQGLGLKPKRAACNYFTKNYIFEFLDYSPGEQNACLRLYQRWMQERQAKSADAIYRGMLGDNLATLKVLLRDWKKLDYIGKIVKIKEEVVAFSFGFALNKETFCIAYEVADLSRKGLAQFIFREFCRQLPQYQYINAMDDSGLENLKRVKLSYRPLRQIPAYILTRDA